MTHDPSEPQAKQDATALRHDLLATDDGKIMRVLALMDEVASPAINRTLLDPLRPRLAVLRPARPLRFGRLLFTPLDPLIVPVADWRAGDPSVPRTALSSIYHAVRAGLGSETIHIDKIIAGQSADLSQALSLAAEALWPRAAEVLAVAPLPADWPETGLPPRTWSQLARAVAAVLRCAPRLRLLAREADTGGLELESGALDDIMRRNIDDPPEAYAMIVRLILLRAPRAMPLLRRLAVAGRNADERTLLNQIIERETDRALREIEDADDLAGEFARVGLEDATFRARRMITLSRILASDASAAMRSRLRAVRDKLGVACVARFAEGVRDGLVAPLAAAPHKLDAVGQRRLENAARELRKLEIVGHDFGDPSGYAAQSRVAAEAMRLAVASGGLAPIRHLRLVEILFGADAAEALYWRDKAPDPPGR
jgi:hypothetical protein